jgi:hypothetical protein
MVACDIGPFWTPLNTQERLFRVNGLARARSIGRRWVAVHPYGQARILEGHHWWPWEKGDGGMTARELMEAWDRFPKLGRVSFLLKSGYMKAEYPEDNAEFIGALDRFSKTEFEELPWKLQDEFVAYMETPIFQIWTRRGGEIDG